MASSQQPALLEYNTHGQAEWNLYAADSKAQFQFFDNLLDHMCENDFNIHEYENLEHAGREAVTPGIKKTYDFHKYFKAH